MKALVVEQFGPPSGLRLRERPTPAPGPGELLIKAHAMGLNFPDVLVVAGKYQTLPPLPFVPGKEVAGIVAVLGAGVEGFSIGDRVMAQLEHGAFAEVVVAPANHCFRLPQGLEMTKAAALGLTYQTAWFGLHERARLIEGETVLVTGAGGGVGVAAMQIAKAAGCRVLAGIGSPDKRDFVLSHGADAVIDMSADDVRNAVRNQVHAVTDGRGVDVVLESVGGAVFEASLRTLAWAGRLVVVGFASGDIATVKTNYLLIKHISVLGLHWSDYRDRTPEAMKSAQRKLFDLVAAGRIDPPVMATFRLEETGAAMDLIVGRKALGKIVIETDRGRAAARDNQGQPPGFTVAGDDNGPVATIAVPAMPVNSPEAVPQGYEVCRMPDGEFGDGVGPLLVRSDESGFALRARPKHCNARGTVHGGMLMTLADQVLGLTVQRAVGSVDVATVSLNCDLVSGAAVGDLIEGEATITRMTRSIVFVRGRLRCGDRVILTASGLWKRLQPSRTSA